MSDEPKMIISSNLAHLLQKQKHLDLLALRLSRYYDEMRLLDLYYRDYPIFSISFSLGQKFAFFIARSALIENASKQWQARSSSSSNFALQLQPFQLSAPDFGEDKWHYIGSRRTESCHQMFQLTTGVGNRFKISSEQEQ